MTTSKKRRLQFHFDGEGSYVIDPDDIASASIVDEVAEFDGVVTVSVVEMTDEEIESLPEWQS